MEKKKNIQQKNVNQVIESDNCDPLVGGHQQPLKRSRFHHPKNTNAELQGHVSHLIPPYLYLLVFKGELFSPHGLTTNGVRGDIPSDSHTAIP